MDKKKFQFILIHSRLLGYSHIKEIFGGNIIYVWKTIAFIDARVASRVDGEFEFRKSILKSIAVPPIVAHVEK